MIEILGLSTNPCGQRTRQLSESVHVHLVIRPDNQSLGSIASIREECEVVNVIFMSDDIDRPLRKHINTSQKIDQERENACRKTIIP